jgi:hypothetical protein
MSPSIIDAGLNYGPSYQIINQAPLNQLKMNGLTILDAKVN